MPLTNTLFAGLSGLNVNQAKLDVVANNIANVNTVAFKGTRVVFKPQFYVTDSGGTQPGGETGGSNPSQRGLGAAVGALERNLTGGSIESTGRATDLAIDGAGMFVVRSNGEQMYTRDGTFKLNPDNKLVNSAGDFVQGYLVNNDFALDTTQVSDMSIPLDSLTIAQATSRVSLKGNLNATGEAATGASVFTSQLLTTTAGTAPTGASLLTDLADAADPATALFAAGDVYTFSPEKGGRNLASSTFTVAADSTLDDLTTFLQQSLGINTTVPDDGEPATPAPGVSFEADATDSNSVRLLIAGNGGTENALSLSGGSFVSATGTMPLSLAEDTTSDPTGESIRTSFQVYDSLGTAFTVNLTAVLETAATDGNTWRFYAESAGAQGGNPVVGTGTLTFDNYGRLQTATGATISIPRDNVGAATPLNVDLDFSQLTALTARNSELVMANQNGTAIGRLSDFSIGTDGRITGTFSNGATRTIGQIVMATFSNPQGLLDRGGNLFVEGPNSGSVVISTPNTLGTGKIVAGALELSNVDLSQEFINMIIASTGFSAASRVITTSDQLMNELLNAAR